ncbi:MAG: transcription initiation factor IIB [Thaumarchaeota archaeon]|nr:transcription initiation factor IIB [Nitrososphaerota archaeon]
MITDVTSGEVICGSCGLVLIEKIEDSGAESSVHDMEEFYTKSRTGPASSLAIHDRGLATNIAFDNKDASGNLLLGNIRYAFDRLRKWDSRSKSTSKNRTLMQAFNLLNSMKAKLAIPDTVIEEAAYIFRKAMNDKMTKGRGIPVIICASLYAACRESDTPRTLKDIAMVGNVKRKNLARAHKILVRNLDLRQPVFDSSEFITRISNEVGISEKTRRDALNLLSRAAAKEIPAGKNPMGLAASVLYLSCRINDERIKQNQLASAAGITAVSIRNRIIDLKKKIKLESV